MNLRLYGGANYIYDTGLTPLALSSQGALERPGGLQGVEVSYGVYGQHTFRRSMLGVDYSGNHRQYERATAFGGSNQSLNLRYAHQLNRRWMLTFNQQAGIQRFGTALASLGVTGIDGSTLLFDNRTSYLQTGMVATYALNNRTAVSMGGTGYMVSRQSASLVGVKGYSLNGSLNRQLTRTTVIGVGYSHLHYDFPRSFGESDINVYTGNWSRDIGRSWQVNVSAGVFTAAIQGVQSTALDPTIAELLGVSSVRTIFYQENLLPMGSVDVVRKFRRANWSAGYSRSVTPGNGVFLTSRQEGYNTNFAYTGSGRWSFSLQGGRYKMDSLGQSLLQFQQTTGGANLSYTLGGGFNLSASYGRRYQDIQSGNFPRNSSRISFGIFFSPGDVPISFH